MRTDLLFTKTRFDDSDSPFSLGKDQRDFRILCDDESINDPVLEKLLSGFSWHEDIWMAGTSAKYRQILKTESESSLTRVIVKSKDTKHVTGFPDTTDWYRFAKHRAANNGFNFQLTEEEFLKQSGFIQMAVSLDVDLLVTSSTNLLLWEELSFHKVNIVSPADAIALIGLFLRNRGDFCLEQAENFSDSVDAGIFYWINTRDLLPASWSWFSAAVSSDSKNNNDLIALAGSALHRCQQLLLARDHIHWKSLITQNNNSATEQLFYMDMLLMAASGAFDVVARVSDYCLGLNTKRHLISWKKEEWQKKLKAACGDLYNSFRKEEIMNTIEIITILRNSIHGEALTSIGYHFESQPRKNLVIISKKDSQKVTEILKSLDLYKSCKPVDGHDNELYLQPSLFIEALLPFVFSALNELMEKNSYR